MWPCCCRIYSAYFKDFLIFVGCRYSQASAPIRHPLWHVPPPSTQPWSSAQPVIPGQPPLMPMRPPQPPQPLFPIQNIQASSFNSVVPSSQTPMVQRPHQPPPQPLFPIQNRQPSPSVSTPLSTPSSMQPLYSPSTVLPPYTPSSQALFPINGPYSNTSVASSIPMTPQYTLPQRPTSELRSLGETSSLSSLPSNLTSKPLNAPAFPGLVASSYSLPWFLWCLFVFTVNTLSYACIPGRNRAHEHIYQVIREI